MAAPAQTRDACWQRFCWQRQRRDFYCHAAGRGSASALLNSAGRRERHCSRHLPPLLCGDAFLRHPARVCLSLRRDLNIHSDANAASLFIFLLPRLRDGGRVRGAVRLWPPLEDVGVRGACAAVRDR